MAITTDLIPSTEAAIKACSSSPWQNRLPASTSLQHCPNSTKTSRDIRQGRASGQQESQETYGITRQRGGYHGYRIPYDRYNGYFGPKYGFVIYNQPFMVVGGFQRFQYAGYWFSVVDPWPNTWANNWYQTDEVYIVYRNDGYYMYNQRYPGIGIAITVSM